MREHQDGFTLVELMVAMAIGTVIILGAGQLFLTTFQTFQNVDKISRKQESLIFAVSTLVEEGRKGNIGNYAIRSDERSSNSGTRYYCVLQDIAQNQPIVDLAQVDGAGDCPVLTVANNNDALSTLTMTVGDCREGDNSNCDEITFSVTDRSKVVSAPGLTP
ncbi:hypothetical protein LCGC14_0265460 [marine sediment metagenome]|uniref:Prepilin-type N-terminal cleavage/methylation domain-containing protein n=1 Tax=marine sediment metagenome TaxID=412755 RepID=A0A0F9WL34_9ZZZZ|nr:prepilin-type N-terminal cleavage/methylation domain-containing protein [Halomonas sp.]HDZ49467.1 prepilin-type N-terminal cleavage/methylation domain-containing protein [Halomonas sp.]HEB03077.1 prepilin-type N-terminal cleavage/methylation domain-containing protein [Halomonas sp.]